MRGIADTSVFIASEEGRPLTELPDDLAVSIITLAELRIGVLQAPDDLTRARRMRTLSSVEREFLAFPVDDDVASAFAAIVASARRAGQRPGVLDVLIAATAVANRVPVYTQDRDFEQLQGVETILV